MTYDPVRSFTPVAQIVTYQFVLVVHPSVSANTVFEFVALARARAGKISYAASQGGLMPYIAAAIFRGMTKVSMLEIPYKTAGQIYGDLLSGQVDSYFAPLAAGMPHISTGKLRPLGELVVHVPACCRRFQRLPKPQFPATRRDRGYLSLRPRIRRVRWLRF